MEFYSLVSNRQGGWNSRGGGGWKKSQKLIAGGCWNSRGEGAGLEKI